MNAARPDPRLVRLVAVDGLRRFLVSSENAELRAMGAALASLADHARDAARERDGRAAARLFLAARAVTHLLLEDAGPAANGLELQALAFLDEMRAKVSRGSSSS